MEDIQLKNGIIIQVADNTVHLAADLYQIRLDVSYIHTLAQEDEELRAICGGRIINTRRLERPAVALPILEDTKKAMLQSFLGTNLRYMQRPSFITKLKAKTLKDYQEQEEKRRRMRQN